MNSRYCLTFKSTFQPEKPKKLENYFFYVKIFDWDYLHLTAQTKETYFRRSAQPSGTTLDKTGSYEDVLIQHLPNSCTCTCSCIHTYLSYKFSGRIIFPIGVFTDIFVPV